MTGCGTIVPVRRFLAALHCRGRMMDARKVKNLFDNLSRAIFGIAALILMLLAIMLAWDAVAQFVRILWSGQSAGISALTGIGYVVVSIAVFDVATYLIDEEVVRDREMRAASETRRSLTRFISTIAIAVFLEALVTVFRVSQDDVEKLIYPTLLLIAAILLVLGLGAFQRLSVSVEKQVEHRDLEEKKSRSQ
jgi:hypothetical protein